MSILLGSCHAAESAELPRQSRLAHCKNRKQFVQLKKPFGLAACEFNRILMSHLFWRRRTFVKREMLVYNCVQLLRFIFDSFSFRQEFNSFQFAFTWQTRDCLGENFIGISVDPGYEPSGSSLCLSMCSAFFVRKRSHMTHNMRLIRVSYESHTSPKRTNWNTRSFRLLANSFEF